MPTPPAVSLTPVLCLVRAEARANDVTAKPDMARGITPTRQAANIGVGAVPAPQKGVVLVTIVRRILVLIQRRESLPFRDGSRDAGSHVWGHGVDRPAGRAYAPRAGSQCAIESRD